MIVRKGDVIERKGGEQRRKMNIEEEGGAQRTEKTLRAEIRRQSKQAPTAEAGLSEHCPEAYASVQASYVVLSSQ